MIRECSRHGYYSDDKWCPACNEEGKFILRSRERDSLARRLALILRHAPEKFDLEMDMGFGSSNDDNFTGGNRTTSDSLGTAMNIPIPVKKKSEDEK